MRIDFGMKVWVETVLLLGGHHCYDDTDHYFYDEDLSHESRPYPAAKLSRVTDG
jgi:hypothetical protein